jgi:uncharacterized membrane protein
MDILSVLFRWFHVVAGILWIGFAFFFNFVQFPVFAALDRETVKKVIPEFVPRGLFWARWAAVVTWVTGIVLLIFIFYVGGLMADESGVQEWGFWKSVITLLVVFALAYAYDLLARSPLGSNQKLFAIVGFILIGAVTCGFIEIGGFGYRAYVIHMGALFGTIMIMNGWMRILPTTKKIISAVKEGAAPDPALLAVAATRSKHVVYLSVPLVWTMINAHTATPAADSWLYLLGVTLIGWLVVAWIYKLVGKVKGP